MNPRKTEPVQIKTWPLLIQTGQLTLRQITEKDAPVIVKLRSDPSDYRFFRLPHQLTLAEHLNWYRESYLQNSRRFDWLALCQEVPTGLFSLNRTQEDTASAEISYLLAPPARGKGYAGEAVDAILQWAVDEWRLKKAFAEIHEENLASIRFIERMGFHYWKRESPFLFYQKVL